MALHGLEDNSCHIFVRRKLTATDQLCKRLKNLNTYLLYPCATSKNIGTIANDTQPKTLIILDGTWDEAKKIYTRSSVLQSLPALHLELEQKSEYIIRTQPSEKCLSTIETIAHSLAILENDDLICKQLLNPLKILCKYQLSHGAVEHDNRSIKTTKVNSKVSTKVVER